MKGGVNEALLLRFSVWLVKSDAAEIESVAEG